MIKNTKQAGERDLALFYIKNNESSLIWSFTTGKWERHRGKRVEIKFDYVYFFINLYPCLPWKLFLQIFFVAVLCILVQTSCDIIHSFFSFVSWMRFLWPWESHRCCNLGFDSCYTVFFVLLIYSTFRAIAEKKLQIFVHSSLSDSLSLSCAIECVCCCIVNDSVLEQLFLGSLYRISRTSAASRNPQQQSQTLTLIFAHLQQLKLSYIRWHVRWKLIAQYEQPLINWRCFMALFLCVRSAFALSFLFTIITPDDVLWDAATRWKH